MTSEAQKRAKKRYDTLKTKQYMFRLRLDADGDIIEQLDSVPQRTDYIRKLVRDDIKRGA